MEELSFYERNADTIKVFFWGTLSSIVGAYLFYQLQKIPKIKILINWFKNKKELNQNIEIINNKFYNNLDQLEKALITLKAIYQTFQSRNQQNNTEFINTIQKELNKINDVWKEGKHRDLLYQLIGKNNFDFWKNFLSLMCWSEDKIKANNFVTIDNYISDVLEVVITTIHDILSDNKKCNHHDILHAILSIYMID